MQRRSFTHVAMALRASDQTYGIRSHTKRAIMIAPILIVFAQAALLIHPATRRVCLWILRENHPVELLTFVLFLIGGVAALLMTLKTRRCGKPPFVYRLYFVLSVALFFIAMEEIAWGQHLFGFHTPECLQSINRQGELTLHNIRPMQGHSEVLRLVFGIGGLIAIWRSSRPSYQNAAVPAILFPWFMVIALHAAVDVFNDEIPIQKYFDYLMMRTSELIELLIAITVLLYIHLNSRRFANQAIADVRLPETQTVGENRH